MKEFSMKSGFSCGLILMFLFGCSLPPQTGTSRISYNSPNGKYDTDFPFSAAGDELKNLVESTRKVYSQVDYKTYLFKEARNLTESDVTRALLAKPDSIVYTQRSVAGTATIILYRSNRIALLSCAHVFDKPDTILTFYRKPKTGIATWLASVSIKERQYNFVTNVPGVQTLDVIALDRENDIAILGQRIGGLIPPNVPILYHPFGQESRLEWGSIVYVIGYPNGYQMITRGMVSKSSQRRKFMIDAPFNKGSSGGLVVAVRDGLPNFEVVGIVTASAGEDEPVLVPEKGWSELNGPQYNGPQFVETISNIKYGITFVTSTDAIVELIKNNLNKLMASGYYFADLIR